MKRILSSFLQRLEYLHDLYLKNVSLSQNFYDRLPEMDQLSLLSLGENVKPMNSDFLFKMNRLKTLFIDQNPREFLDLAMALFTSIRFQNIYFFFNNELYSICANSLRNEYSVLRERNTKNEKTERIFEKEGMNFDELVGFLTAYKNYGLTSHSSG